MKTIVIQVFGRVQGVYYRASTLKKATSLGLTGWVRNRLNGSVEILATGHEKKIQDLIEWSQQGPPASKVERIEIDDVELRSHHEGFTIESTV